MPSTARRKILNEAFDAMDVMAEIRIVELAQVLAERFPKQMVALSQVEGVNIAGLLEMIQARPSMSGNVQTM